IQTRLEENAATLAELGRAREEVEAAVAAELEMSRNVESARARLALLTGRDLERAQLAPIAQVLVAKTQAEAEERAKHQRPEVQVAFAEAQRWRSEATNSWRTLGEIEVGVGYTQGTTGSLDELAGVSVFAELSTTLDAPFRFADTRRRAKE